LQKANESMLAPALAESRVIPNGIDLAVFRHRDKEWARAQLDIPQSAKVIVFAATSIRHNVYKDFGTMRAALSLLGNSEGKSVIFLALGEDAPLERIGSIELRFVPYCPNPEMIARYYQAADVYIHGARADTFPNSVIEALACGTPVVATAVGGIPEQVKGLKMSDPRWSDGSNSYPLQQATGLLVAPADAEGMAFCIARLLKDRPLRYRLGANAARDARARFDLEIQVDRYLDWYRELLSNPSQPTVNDSALRSKPRHA
jgi:glycosyltransferase involved in cell wall biosynthesis